MSPLPNTARKRCKHCSKRMEPRRSESKYGYAQRQFCNARCESAWRRVYTPRVLSAAEIWKEGWFR